MDRMITLSRTRRLSGLGLGFGARKGSIVSVVVGKPTGGSILRAWYPTGELWNGPIGLGTEGYPPIGRPTAGVPPDQSLSYCYLSYSIYRPGGYSSGWIPHGGVLHRLPRCGGRGFRRAIGVYHYDAGNGPNERNKSPTDPNGFP